MILHYPDIFDAFSCTGSDCKDNCCRIGWDISIDEDTYKFYKILDSELGKKLTESIYEEDGCLYMSQPDGCPFMNEKGLCSVQLEYGEEHISEICREHPRFYEWFGDYKEAGVGLSCEETARLITEHPRPIIFTEREIPEESDDLPFDPQLLTGVKKIRDILIDIAQDRGLSIKERLLIILCSCDDIQQAVLEGNIKRLSQLTGMLAIDGFRVEIINETASRAPFDKSFYNELSALMRNMEYINSGLKKLFTLDDKMTDKLISSEQKFDRIYDEHSFELEHIAVYFIYRYFIKCTRDLAVTEHIYAAIISTMAVRALFLAEYVHKGKLPDKARRALLIKEFSKEIEYSPDNMDRIYEAIQTGEILRSK